MIIILRPFALALAFVCTTISVIASHNDEAGVIFAKLRDHTSYQVSEARRVTSNQAIKYKKPSKMPIVKLCYEIDKLGIYEDVDANSSPFLEVFKSPSLALKAYSTNLSSFWAYLLVCPPVLTSCFRLNLDQKAIKKLNDDNGGTFVSVHTLYEKPYLSIGQEHVESIARGLDHLVWKTAGLGSIFADEANKLDVARYLAHQAIWNEICKSEQLNLFPQGYLHARGLVNITEPICETLGIDSFGQAIHCLDEITQSYNKAIELIEGVITGLEPAWYVINEDETNRARITVLEDSASNLGNSKRYYEHLTWLFGEARSQIFDVIRNVGMRNESCIQDPLYYHFVNYLKVPSMDRHIYLNSYWHAIVDCMLIPLVKNGIPCLAVTAAGLVYILPAGIPLGFIYYGLFIKAGFTSGVAIGSGITAALTPTALAIYLASSKHHP